MAPVFEGPFQRIVAAEFPEDIDPGPYEPYTNLYTTSHSAIVKSGWVGMDPPPEPASITWGVGNWQWYQWVRPYRDGAYQPYQWVQILVDYNTQHFGGSDAPSRNRVILGQPTTSAEKVAGVVPWTSWLDASPEAYQMYGTSHVGTSCTVNWIEQGYYPPVYGIGGSPARTEVLNTGAQQCDFSSFVLRPQYLLGDYVPVGWTTETNDSFSAWDFVTPIPKLVLQRI